MTSFSPAAVPEQPPITLDASRTERAFPAWAARIPAGERERAYTRDLYFCYEAFARHYAERERDMWRALELAVDPSRDPAEVLAFVSDLGGWLVARTPEVFPQKGERPG